MLATSSPTSAATQEWRSSQCAAFCGSAGAFSQPHCAGRLLAESFRFLGRHMRTLEGACNLQRAESLKLVQNVKVQKQIAGDI